MMYQDQA